MRDSSQEQGKEGSRVDPLKKSSNTGFLLKLILSLVLWEVLEVNGTRRCSVGGKGARLLYPVSMSH